MKLSWWLSLFVALRSADPIFGKISINVKNKGGEIIPESIVSNITEDVVTLEFQKVDGTFVTEVIDFEHEVKILKVLVLGEEDMGQSQYQVICFVTHDMTGDFLPPAAISELKQKKSRGIRTAKITQKPSNITFDFTMNVRMPKVAKYISKHTRPTCDDTQNNAYGNENDLKIWGDMRGVSLHKMKSVIKRKLPKVDVNCSEISNLWLPCKCHLSFVVPWYPCGYKFCRIPVEDGEEYSTPFKCGVKTCRKAYHLTYSVKYKQLCLWDHR